MKIAVARDGVVRRCRAVANNGVGLWFDIDVRDVVVENCFCSENAGHGIFVEISGGFTIREQLVYRHGTDDAWDRPASRSAKAITRRSRTTPACSTPQASHCAKSAPRLQGHRPRTNQLSRARRDGPPQCLCLEPRYQIGLWWDNPFFGPHPTPSVGAKGIPLDPDEANLPFRRKLLLDGGGTATRPVGLPVA